jgi:8-oxo-dGTP pyrophosphatase MutT (NUDIX family)
MNSFQWAKARLALDHPEASLVVQRFEADSKFFRSLVVVTAGSAVAGALVQHRYGLLWGLLLAVAAFVRYVDQRVKATRQAYWFMIAIAAADAAASGTQVPMFGVAEFTHAGGVVYRNTGNGGDSSRSGAVQFLLVRPTSRDAEWVLPKGHIEPAEKPAETAVREVLEEAGVLARIDQKLATIQFPDGDDQATVAFYLMEFAAERKSTEAAHREPFWFDAQVAIERATHQESKELLTQASVLLSQRSHASDARR